MKPTIALAKRYEAVRTAASRYHTENPRVFGSVLHGTDRDGSDLDLLVLIRPLNSGTRATQRVLSPRSLPRQAVSRGKDRLI